MKSCTFFGHRQIWENLDGRLDCVLIDLIENQMIKTFYIGNQGDFDKIVLDRLRKLKKRYRDIKYFVVLAYLPSKGNQFAYKQYAETIYPEGIEKVMPKYAITMRNQWMINQSDIVITYVQYPVGGAAKAEEYAKKERKKGN